jgi:hypothetical protein
MKIGTALQWVRSYCQILDGFDYQPTAQRRISVSFLHLSLEHNQSIMRLIQSNLIGSAYALLRPQKEAFVKGLWYSHCANESDTNSFIKNKELPKTKRMYAEINLLSAYGDGVLSDILSTTQDDMHDFTHGGFFQVASRSQGRDISSKYSHQHLLCLVDQTTPLSSLAALELVKFSDNENLKHRLMSSYFKLYPSL